MTDTIRIQNDRFCANIYLPKLTELPQSKCRKLFNLMLSDPWLNQQAIDDLTTYFDRAIADGKAAWHQASVDYQQEWRIIEKPTRRQTRAEAITATIIKAHNEQLTRACKRTRAQYERWVKYKSIWEAAAQKCGCPLK